MNFKVVNSFYNFESTLADLVTWRDNKLYQYLTFYFELKTCRLVAVVFFFFFFLQLGVEPIISLNPSAT